MEPQPQITPLKIALFADFGIGLTNLGDSWNMESAARTTASIFIYKYMEAGLPVPNHLLLPIWKSVTGGHHGSPYQLYSGLLGCGSLHLEYTNGMDPEPGRCRRTDGKKWRCSKEAVTYHKYCERHMHRGRQSSRKLVETSQATTRRSISHGNADTSLSISLQLDSSSSSNNGSNLSSSGLIGFSPKSVLRGSNPKSESPLQFHGF
ncbi:Growth-regulating factor 12 [Hibiscus syriacus]|uniref:Growth-regulating factor n=1 Tax=Hibiscus syriacus TaxID=106335 RepID=A0A6A3B9H6_HIBSY|nr:Growth-regulating factor 12 [Hibiscus syriacus]